MKSLGLGGSLGLRCQGENRLGLGENFGICVLGHYKGMLVYGVLDLDFGFWVTFWICKLCFNVVAGNSMVEGEN